MVTLTGEPLTGEQFFNIVKQVFHNNNQPVLNSYEQTTAIEKIMLDELAEKFVLKPYAYHCSCPNSGWVVKENSKVCLSCGMEVL